MNSSTNDNDTSVELIGEEKRRGEENNNQKKQKHPKIVLL